MHDDRSLIERRLFRVARDRIDTAMTGASHPLTVSAWEVPGEPVHVTEAAAATFEPFQVGDMFGRPWGTTWFRMTGEVPADWAGRTVLAAVNLGFGLSPGFQSEGLGWVRRGDEWVPWRGLHPLNHHLPIAAPATGGETVDWLVEAASNPEISIYGDPNSDLPTAGTGPIYSLRKAAFVESHTDVVALREAIRARSEPWFGGPSITIRSTRARSAGGSTSIQRRTTRLPRLWPTKWTRSAAGRSATTVPSACAWASMSALTLA